MPPTNPTDPYNWAGIALAQKRKYTSGQPRSPSAYEAARMQEANNPDPYNWRAIAAAQQRNSPSAVQNAPRSLSMPVGQPVAPEMDLSASGGIDSLGPSRTDLDALYAELAKSIRQGGASVQKEYGNARTNIDGNYSRSNADMYREYQNNRGAMNESATGIGADPNTMLHGYDAGLRRIEENSNLAETADQSFLEKMRATQSDAIQTTLRNVDQDKMNAKIAQTDVLLQMANDRSVAESKAMEAAMKAASKSGGGGSSRGSRGGGGGSSRGGAKEKATLKEELLSVGDLQIYQNLLATDPEQAAVFYNHLTSSTGSYVSRSIAKQRDDLVKNAPVASQDERLKIRTSADPFVAGVVKAAQNKVISTNNAAARAKYARDLAKYKRDLAILNKTLTASLGISGVLGNPRTTANVNSTATRRS